MLLRRGGTAIPVLGQILLLRLFIRLFVNFTLKLRLWSSPHFAKLCKENNLPLVCYVSYCSQLHQLPSSYLSGNLEESTDVSGIKEG